MVTERIVDGATVYSAIRGDDGFVMSETDERGRTVAYARDAFGRVTVRTEPYADGLAMETHYRYAPGIYRGLDTRPLEKIRPARRAGDRLRVRCVRRPRRNDNPP